jgi:hypothetical protein
MNVFDWVGRGVFTTMLILVAVAVAVFVWNQQVGIAQAQATSAIIDAR